MFRPALEVFPIQGLGLLLHNRQNIQLIYRTSRQELQKDEVLWRGNSKAPSPHRNRYSPLKRLPLINPSKQQKIYLDRKAPARFQITAGDKPKPKHGPWGCRKEEGFLEGFQKTGERLLRKSESTIDILREP